MGSSTSTRKHKRLRTFFIVLGILIAIRVALPYVLLHVANDRLSKIPGYYGHIADLDLAIIRGAYTLEQFYLNKVDTITQDSTAFLAADIIDLSVYWSALFKGSIVGELEIEGPMLRFTKDKAEPSEVQSDTASLGDALNDFMPLRIDRLALNNGRIEYLDAGSDPKVHLALTQLNALALNLTSVQNTEQLLPSSVKASADLYGGNLNFNMKLDPLSKQSLFDMDLTLETMDLTQVNEFFDAYADFDVNEGTMSLYAELATRDGAFKGYFKPLLKNLDVLGKEDKDDNLLRKLWEAAAGTTAAIFSNRKKEQFATKIPLEGRLDDPNVRTWVAIIGVLRNAFIQSLTPAIDREVSISSVENTTKDKGLFQSLFGKDEKKGAN